MHSDSHRERERERERNISLCTKDSVERDPKGATNIYKHAGTLCVCVPLIYREKEESRERRNAIPERILGMGAAKSDLSIAAACKKRFIVIAIEASAASPNAT